MTPRRSDGSVGDANCARIGSGYSHFHQPEPQIATIIHRALVNARGELKGFGPESGRLIVGFLRGLCASA